MLRTLKQAALWAVVLMAGLSVQAQKKDLGNDQYFKSNFKGITQALPTVNRWIDDSHLLLRRDGKNYVIDCKTGT
ncbi:MAG TPA: hypothetical protein PKL81_14525, partial [Ferruginibacter sp.]|nr:hypothetical protein [Ferruginibacter sp.]